MHTEVHELENLVDRLVEDCQHLYTHVCVKAVENWCVFADQSYTAAVVITETLPVGRVRKLFTLVDICTRTAHGTIDEIEVYSVFCKTNSLSETLRSAATMMSERFSESNGDRTSQKLRMAASNLS